MWVAPTAVPITPLDRFCVFLRSPVASIISSDASWAIAAPANNRATDETIVEFVKEYSIAAVVAAAPRTNFLRCLFNQSPTRPFALENAYFKIPLL